MQCLWALSLLLSAVSVSAQPYPQPAFRAEDFAEFVGINGSPVKFRVYEDGLFKGAGATYPPEVFHELGVRQYRVCLKYDLTLPDQPDQVRRAYEEYGARATFLIDPGKSGTAADVVALVKQYPREAIAAIEGPNECNNKFPPQELNLRYGGKTDEAAGAAYMNDVYAALKADPATRDIPVIAYTAIFTDYRLAKGHTAFDFANMHSYQGHGVPTSSLLANETRTNNLLPVGGLVRPYMPTECGYNVTADDPAYRAAQLTAQARNVPMLLAEYFRHGIPRAYLFALHNADGYGLLDDDLQTRRPAYVALQSLMAAVKDADWNPQTQRREGGRCTPRSLGFTLEGAPESAHTVTLQKASGEYLLLIWNEVPNLDEAARRLRDDPPVPVTVRFTRPIEPEATLLTPTDAGPYATSTASVAEGRLRLEVRSSVMVVRLRPEESGAANVPAPTGVTADATEDTVALRWEGTAEGYLVYRNGCHVASLPGDSREFRDHSEWVRPGLGYTYAVQAMDAAGNLSPRAEVVAQTAARFPDLVLTDIELPKVKAGEEVRFRATVRNIGDGLTPPNTMTGISFYVDEQFISWSTNDGAQLRPGESLTLEANGGPKGTPVWLATAGPHVLRVEIDDINRFPGERSKTNNRSERTFTIDAPSAGMLVGAADPAPGQVDLTAEGTEDWVHWGLTETGTVTRKTTGGGLFGPLEEIGQGYTDRTGGFGMSASWSDGTPTEGSEPTYTSLWWNCVGHGWRFAVPAGPEERTLRVYVGGIEGAACTLTATLSDGSAPEYVSRCFNGNAASPWAPVPDGFTGVYTLRYRAASAGEKLTVSWALDGEPNQFLGQARMQAATLAR